MAENVGYALANGDVILDRYEVFGCDRGGFGVVYFVRDAVKDERLAIKIPRLEPEDEGQQAEAVEAFALEVRFWLDLDSHPNVISAHFVRDVLGSPALFMEYADGGNLRRRLRSGSMKEGPAYHVAHQLATAMEFANRRGEIAHLDLKPENLLFSGDTLKVTDFGSAHRVRLEHGSYMKTDSATWRYAAPEMFEGGVGDTRSDVFSYGLILYEMFAGRLPYPFKIQSTVETYDLLAEFHRTGGMRAITRELYNSGVPGCSSREVGVIVSACLAAYPGERPGSFRSLLDMLERSLGLPASRGRQLTLTTEQHFERARTLLSVGQLSPALNKFNQLLVRESGVALYWREAAKALEAYGDFVTANEFEERARKLEASEERQ